MTNNNNNPANDVPKMDRNSAEFRQWNRLADGMDRFHNAFRAEYADVYRKATAKFKGDSFKYFIREAEMLAIHLGNHHRIEEAYIFPMLAPKLPQFGQNTPQSASHITAHRGIHDGLEKYSAYLNAAKRDPDSYDGNELRKIMESFHDVLFNHLDEEVRDLGAESVRKAGFTLQELNRFPL